ncbi:hypothetical protein MPH_13691 [Macrophomina phaseolina MS6]|uniref:Uncharacterized protein n=2 Tax=Macrophomina phaseolina TaxID=35725 RepID=K2QHM2_MACPH|nr:hypothetical protein MPH_13691 [Macrophomina phaseolina MS6]KAH7028251.1 hypothetical protein B0J12DRAFT_704681 [Macrophomina phaseolina]
MNSFKDCEDVQWFLDQLSNVNGDSGQDTTSSAQPECHGASNNLMAPARRFGEASQVDVPGDKSGPENFMSNNWKGIGCEPIKNHTSYCNEADVTEPTTGLENFLWPSRATVQSSNDSPAVESLKKELETKDQEIQQISAKLGIVEEYIRNTTRWIETHRAITMPFHCTASAFRPDQVGIEDVQTSNPKATKQQQEERREELREIKEKIVAIESYVNQATQWMKKLHETVLRLAGSP